MQFMNSSNQVWTVRYIYVKWIIIKQYSEDNHEDRISNDLNINWGSIGLDYPVIYIQGNDSLVEKKN